MYYFDKVGILKQYKKSMLNHYIFSEQFFFSLLLYFKPRNLKMREYRHRAGSLSSQQRLCQKKICESKERLVADTFVQERVIVREKHCKQPRQKKAGNSIFLPCDYSCIQKTFIVCLLYDRCCDDKKKIDPSLLETCNFIGLVRIDPSMHKTSYEVNITKEVQT